MNKTLVYISFVFIFIVSCSAVSAANDSNSTAIADININDEIISSDNDIEEISQDSQNNEVLSDSASTGKTITVVADKSNPNQVLNPTVQPVIDSANPGDTIILKGTFVHCHFTINKTLTIIGQDGTIDPCPHHTHEGISEFGVFYIAEGGSGSVIEGFNFVNKDKSETPFAILISGASDVTIRNCQIDDDTTDVDKYSGIVVENSKNVELTNLIVNNTLNGIRILDSSDVMIEDSMISNTENSAVSIVGTSNNINIYRNNILGNHKSGIYLTAANNVNIINNLIRDNGNNNPDSGSGIYVNTNITKLAVKGNIFLSNGDHAILYDYRCRNLNFDDDAYKLTDVDNNYFEGHKSMILHHRIYVERDYGDLKYDAENDVYGSIGEGNYAEAKSYVYMKNALIFNDIPCGFTFYTNKIPWSSTAPGNDGKYDFNLRMNLRQVKSGLYRVAIVDSKGNAAADFTSFAMTVFLNDYFTVMPQDGDVYRNVSIQNGVGTADFRDDYASFKSSGNVITAVFPGLSDRVDRNVNVHLNVSDSAIPINPKISLSASKLTTYPLADAYFSAKLLNSKNQPISGERISFKVNGKTFTATTDKNGIAKIKLSLSSKKTYPIIIEYRGSDDYNSSKITSSVVVKTGSKKSKVKASNMKVKRNKKKTFSFKLLAGNGKALKSQKVIVKLNGKTYNVKTNGKGIAKITVKLNKVKKYKIKMNFLGNANFKAASKTCTIKVVKK